MTMMTMMMTMTMMTIMLMLMVMMTTAPQGEDSQTATHPQTQAEELMANVEECGKSIKEILTGMSATDLILACGPQGREQGEGFAKARHALERFVQKESAPQRATAPQTALPRDEQYKHPDEGNISDYQSCSSSPGR